ncbi:MAG: hypothetical protein ACJ789_01420 [Thermomicrobiales bacterium]
MQRSGFCLSGGSPRLTELIFWGEWEAQSNVVSEISEPVRDGPRWIYRPYFERPSSYTHLQNTDPFVFGDQFHYTGCLQHTKHGPTQMRNLSRGSVILFGSCLHRSAFVLDTVFVVDHWIDHSLHDYQENLRGRISDTYAAVTIAPWYANTWEPDKVHRLYFGATYQQSVDGMFSFFPCIQADKDSRGFARPEIILPGIVTPNQTQNKKLTFRDTTRQIAEIWQEVKRQVIDQGLLLGVRADLPPEVHPSSE